MEKRKGQDIKDLGSLILFLQKTGKGGRNKKRKNKKSLDENIASNIQNQFFKNKSCQASLLSLQESVRGLVGRRQAVNIYTLTSVRLLTLLYKTSHKLTVKTWIR